MKTSITKKEFNKLVKQEYSNTLATFHSMGLMKAVTPSKVYADAEKFILEDYEVVV